ncbi:MAG: glutamine ABC transporter permease [Actinobacteria bacterium]|nr:glutamine ABC transporter permease [Actinomycetota bacterium]
MWLISLRDLEFRRRRFTIAIAATALTFAMTLMMAGFGATLHNEIRRIVDVIGADSWIVAKGTSGPFTASTVVPAETTDSVAAAPGVEEASALVLLHSTMRKPADRDVNVIGYSTGGVGEPPVLQGRAPEVVGEALVDTALGVGVGDSISVGGLQLQAVGTSDGITYYFGTPTIFVPLENAQDMAFSGQDLVTTVVTSGEPSSLPQGLEALTPTQVRTDLERPLANGTKSIDLISVLLWITAAGIIGSIIYLSALERTRDFAVLKATGAPNSALMGGLALQAIVLSVTSAALAIVLAQLLAPLFPFGVEISVRAYVSLFVIAVSVGLVASVAGLRRAVRVDPALAFGGH